MESGTWTITVIGVAVGFLQGLNAFILSGMSRKIDNICRENREDHHDIYDKLDEFPKEYQTIRSCTDKIVTCNQNRDEKIRLRISAVDSANGKAETLLKERRQEQFAILEERRGILMEKLEVLTKGQASMVASFGTLSECVSKYTKGECS